MVGFLAEAIGWEKIKLGRLEAGKLVLKVRLLSHEYDGTYLWFVVWFGSQGSIELVNDLVAK